MIVSKSSLVRMILGALLCLAATPSRAEEIPPLSIPGRSSLEGSSLLPVENQPLLQANGWRRAFWVAFDEGKDSLGLLAQKSGDNSWELKAVSFTAPQPEIDDAEALARKNGFVYIVGSHFGKKDGKLKAARQFVARFREDAIQPQSLTVPLEVRLDGFKLHRLLNDGLVKQKIDLIDRGAGEKAEFIEKTRKSDEPGSDNVRESDRALNIEGATFLPTGQLALGLRYPVTRKGEPLVVVLDGVEALFQDQLPKVVAVWILSGAGTPKTLRGFRELQFAGGEMQAILGSIERDPGKSPLLKDHPGADAVTSEHRAFKVPGLGKTLVDSRAIRNLARAANVEGVWVDADGDWYLFDEDAVRVRHEVR